MKDEPVVEGAKATAEDANKSAPRANFIMDTRRGTFSMGIVPMGSMDQFTSGVYDTCD
jgi:hypothetical protein